MVVTSLTSSYVQRESTVPGGQSTADRGESQARGGRESLIERARRLMLTEIDFIPNETFRRSGAAEDRCPANENAEVVEAGKALAGDDEGGARRGGGLRRDLPTHLAVMCESKLLTPEEEREQFRRMNLLKYRANVLRSTIDPDVPCEETIKNVERCLSEARKVRDAILGANMRLVISIVKKFVTSQHSFDELLSDGIISLMHAVEKFDYDRGFRFSTYAYRAISRNAYRKVSGQREQKLYAMGDGSEPVFDLEVSTDRGTIDELVWERQSTHLKRFLGELDRREQFIIRGRYALGAHRKARTFQSLADKLGISKERVRQLEQRAVAKLKSMAESTDVEEMALAV